MTRAATQAEQFDRAHDHRKNYIPEPPLSVQTAPLSTAMEVAVAVKALDNYPAAAALIETYAQSVVQAARLDKAVSA